jgi:hypothetical protein
MGRERDVKVEGHAVVGEFNAEQLAQAGRDLFGESNEVLQGVSSRLSPTPCSELQSRRDPNPEEGWHHGVRDTGLSQAAGREL